MEGTRYLVEIREHEQNKRTDQKRMHIFAGIVFGSADNVDQPYNDTIYDEYRSLQPVA